MSKLDGRCLCGAVSYTSQAEPAFTAICHCKDCQRQSGAAFSIVVGVPVDQFDVQGELAEHVTVSDSSGIDNHRKFCPSCGSPVFSLNDTYPGIAIVKAGTLDDPSWLEPQIEVWGRSAQPWFEPVEGRPRWERATAP